MFVEIVVLKAKSGDAERLRDGLRAARTVLVRAAGYRRSVFYQGVESAESFILHIEWDTLAAHMDGFRQGPLFPEWRSHFQAFLDAPPTMAHYQPIAGP